MGKTRKTVRFEIMPLKSLESINPKHTTRSKTYYEVQNILRGPPLELTKAQAGTKMRSCACGRFRLHSLL